MEKKNGFTILEMMIVMLIVALLLLITLPNIQQKEKIIRNKGCEALLEIVNKPYPNKNGFTLVEMLVVLLIVSMLGFGLSTKIHSSLYVFMKNLQTLCITAQEKAYVKHRKVYVEIDDSIYMDDVEYKIPHDIACDHVSFYYNAKGNMSKAMSLHCQNASSQMKLVFQVGAGRVRLEKE